MKLPKIDYDFWLSNWNDTVGRGKVYTNKNLREYIKFDNDINSCTAEIYKLTKSNKLSKQTILQVVDLIYSWGGPSGRMFYSKTNGKESPREELEMNKNTFQKYLDGIKLAKEGKTSSIKMFNSIRGIGPSYASKHSYFWSVNSYNPLIIIDSKIAGALGYNTIDLLLKDYSYTQIIKSFIHKAEAEFKEINPTKVERALFAFHNFYFLNDNSNWKNKNETENFEEAKRLANILFEK